MNRKYIALFVAAFALAGSFYAVKIHAASTPAEIATCMKTAIDTRDTGIKSAFETYGSSYQTATNTYYSTNTNAKETYYNAIISAQRTMDRAYITAWSAYVTSRSAAIQTRNAALQQAWTTYSEDAAGRKTAVETAWSNFKNAIGKKVNGDAKGAALVLAEARNGAKVAYNAAIFGVKGDGGAKKAYNTALQNAKTAYIAAMNTKTTGAKAVFEAARTGLWKTYRTAVTACTGTDSEPKGTSTQDKI